MIDHGKISRLSASRKGEIAEVLFTAGAMVNDWEIFLPLGHAQTTDVCVIKPLTAPVRVQVKTAWWDDARHAFQISVRRSGSYSGKKRPYVSGDFDVLAGYLPELNQFVFWSFADISGRQKINYSPNRHRKPSNWELLDQVATIYSQESQGVSQPLSDPLPNTASILL